MAKMDEMKEDISLMSKLLMATVGTIVVTVGGVVGLFLSDKTGVVFLGGSIVIMVLTVVFCGLFFRAMWLIRQLGGL